MILLKHDNLYYGYDMIVELKEDIVVKYLEDVLVVDFLQRLHQILARTANDEKKFG